MTDCDGDPVDTFNADLDTKPLELNIAAAIFNATPEIYKVDLLQIDRLEILSTVTKAPSIAYNFGAISAASFIQLSGAANFISPTEIGLRFEGSLLNPPPANVSYGPNYPGAPPIALGDVFGIVVRPLLDPIPVGSVIPTEVDYVINGDVFDTQQQNFNNCELFVRCINTDAPYQGGLSSDVGGRSALFSIEAFQT